MRHEFNNFVLRNVFAFGKNAFFRFTFFRTAENLCRNKQKQCVFRCVASATHFLFFRGENMDFKTNRSLDDMGRLVIPADFRKLYGIKPGEKVVITATDQGILVTKQAE